MQTMQREHEHLKLEVDQSREELTKLRRLAVMKQRESEEEEEGGGGSSQDGHHQSAAQHSQLTDNQLIMKLQRQLDSERLNVMNLRQQLEIERQYSARLVERQNSAAVPPQSVAAAAPNGTASIGGLLRMSAPSLAVAPSVGDSLGLQGLLKSSLQVRVVHRDNTQVCVQDPYLRLFPRYLHFR